MALGEVSSVDIQINDKIRTGSFAGDTIDIFLAGFNAEFNEFGNTKSFSLDTYKEPYGYNEEKIIEDMRRAVSYGEFVFGVLSHELFTSLSLFFFDRLEESFGVTNWRDHERAIGKGEGFSGSSFDYWFFARRGDFSFVPREGLTERDGEDHTVTLETSLVEQLGEDGTLFTPVSYAGKVAGQSTPKAHRLFRRFVEDRLAPIDASKSEVSQAGYNLISQPDLEGVETRSGTIFEDRFNRARVHDTEIGEGWSIATSSPPVKGASEMAGARIFDNNVVLGPAPLNTGAFEDLSGGADESDWEGETPDDISVYRSIREKSSFLMQGTFQAPKNRSASVPLYINAFKPESSPEAIDGYGFAVLTGDTNNVLITDGHEITPSTDRSDWPLPSASMPIERGKEYEYICLYGEGGKSDDRQSVELSLWIWPDEGVRSDKPVIKAGAKVPVNVRDELVGQQNHVGFGTNRLKDGYWAINQFEARSIRESYSQALMELDVTGQRGEMNLVVTARGQGAKEGGEIEYGHSLYVWDHQSETWDLLEAPSYGAYKAYTHSVNIDLLPEYVDSGRIYVLASTNERHLQSLGNTVESRIGIDYVYGRSVPVERKTYGKTDFYFRQKPDQSTNDRGFTSYRPSQEVEFIVRDISPMNVLSVDPSTSEGLSAPLEEILEVTVLDDNDQEVVGLDERTEYRYFWRNEALRGSMREKVALVVQGAFAGQDIKVRARVHSTTRLIDEYFQSNPQRKIDGDILAMHKQSVFVDVFAKHEGGATGLEEAVREWIFDYEGNEMTVSDLVRFLGKKGADDILLYDGSNESDAIRLNSRRIDKNGNEQTESSFTLLKKEVTETFVPGTVRIISI